MIGKARESWWGSSDWMVNLFYNKNILAVISSFLLALVAHPEVHYYRVLQQDLQQEQDYYYWRSDQ
jgi:hypothetical protein